MENAENIESAEAVEMREAVRVSKRNSVGALIEYKLYISKNTDNGAGDICSIGIETSCERSLVRDICRDRERAEGFLYLLVREEVEPCHLADIVYDLLPI